MHVECGKTSKGSVDVPLCGLFVFVVVFFVEWEWGVVGDGVPQVVFCKSKHAHVFFVVVECGAKVGFVPLNVFERATQVWGVVEGFLHVFRHALSWSPPWVWFSQMAVLNIVAFAFVSSALASTVA